MLAEIKKDGNGYIAKFERHLNHSAEDVWSYLTDNDKLPKWFPELRVGELREGGGIKFNMGNGTFIEMTITELKMQSILEYTWAADLVRFELYPKIDGCKLVLNEKLTSITGHTPRDLAGWHVCLDVIEAMLDGRTIESRNDVWKIWYEKYIKAIEEVSV
ncbi:SRPBCC family protein [Paenibacillus sp. BSR1-1]|uniref:SRPBCC family protein n=1 Tax=Paenibacillus sp. BSR1-1 TaxID=3020845 RepID=UPI0025B0E646|nr:SRPBCC family protein [Paenibacillus sp. BSR1-1]MDN3016532.1 SRPBCC family protein [Paenibacillus sp. BSR1-1]